MAVYTPPNPLPPDRNVNPTLMGVSGVLIALIVITSSIRIWVRYALRRLGADDYTMIAATAICIARFGVQVAQGRSGNGRHRWAIPHASYVHNSMLGWVAQLLLFAGVCVLKCSILLLVNRIKDSKRLRRLTYAVMAGLIVTNLGCIIILLAECSPVNAYWTGNGKCWNAKVRIYAIYFTIAYSIVTDILCSMLPLVVIWKLRLKWLTKLSVWALTSLGLVATGFGIARAASLGTVTSDLSYVYAVTAIWSNLELFLGVIAANLALSRQVYAYFFGDGSGHLHPSSYYNNSRKAGTSSNNNNNNNTIGGGGTLPRSVPSVFRRPPSVSPSDNSDIPLEWGIQKRTDFWITEHGADAADNSHDGQSRDGHSRNGHSGARSESSSR